MRLFWSVALGAAAGGVSRYYLSGFIQQRAGSGFPVGTLVINITGSFLLGFIMRYALKTEIITAATRALLTTGFCGGYTTFSTFTYETALMMDDGEYSRAALYVGTSVVIGIVCMYLGFAAANRLLALRAHA